MKPSPHKDKKSVDQQPKNRNKETYQTPDIVYEGTISIRAGSPIGFTDPGDPFAEDIYNK